LDAEALVSEVPEKSGAQATGMAGGKGDDY
jgi:hypothetical protein